MVRTEELQQTNGRIILKKNLSLLIYHLGSFFTRKTITATTRPTETIPTTAQKERVLEMINENIHLNLLHHEVQTLLGEI